MFYLALTCIAMLLCVNYLISRSLLCPTTLFSAVWLACLASVLLPLDTFYSISAKALAVYILGALAFSVAGSAVLFLSREEPLERSPLSERGRARVHFALDLLLVTVVAGLPLYWHAITSRAGDVEWSSLLVSLRQIDVESSGEPTEFGLVNNLSILAIFVALAMHHENTGAAPRRWRSYAAIAAALVYGSVTGTKGNAVKLVLMLLFMSSIRTGRVQVRQWLTSLLVLIPLFAVGLIIVNFFYLEFDDSAEMLQLLGKTIHNYWAGGLIAFGRIAESPNSMDSTHHLNRFFLETANSLGAHFRVPPLHAEYTNISPSQMTNVYTIYFSYFKDHGWAGVIGGLAFLGAVTTWLYRGAKRNWPVATIFYSMTAVGIVGSVFAEGFFLWLNFYIKAAIFLVVIYRVVPAVWTAEESSDRHLGV